MALKCKDSFSDRIQFGCCARSGVPSRASYFERRNGVFQAVQQFVRIRFRESIRTSFSPGLLWIYHPGAFVYDE
jgi:hypothetical protein